MGRPLGSKNKVTKEGHERAAFWGDKALKRVVELMDSQNETVALGACKELLDRAYGKPIQARVLLGQTDSWDELKDGELLDRIHQLQRLIAGSGSGAGEAGESPVGAGPAPLRPN